MEIGFYAILNASKEAFLNPERCKEISLQETAK